MFAFGHWKVNNKDLYISSSWYVQTKQVLLQGDTASQVMDGSVSLFLSPNKSRTDHLHKRIGSSNFHFSTLA